MNKKGDRPGGRKLSPEDRALWEAFSSAITPSDAKHRVPERRVSSSLNNDSRETIRPKPIERPGAASRPVATINPKSSPTKGNAKQVDVTNFDRNTARKLARGRTGIDARIDLHGMRQAEAQVALRGFLNRAAQSGYRTVLVITGKGGNDDERTVWEPGRERSGRGILRRNVPLWLSSPELSELVSSFTTAHSRHGGDGAFYVQIRRKGRRADRG